MPLIHMRMDKAAKRFYRKLETGDLAKYTMQQKRRTIDRLVEVAGPSLPTKALKYEHFDTVIEWLRYGESPEDNAARQAKGLRARTGVAEHNMTFYRGTLKQFVEFLKYNGAISMRFNPLYEITKSSRPTGTKVQEDPKAIPYEEWEDFLATAAQRHPRDFMLCILGLTQGRRVSEFREAKIGDIDWKRSEIVYTNVKRSRKFHEPLDLATEHYLKDYLAWYERLHGPLQPHWYLFPPRYSATEITQTPGLKAKVDANPQVWPLHPERKADTGTLIRAVKAILKAHGWEDTYRQGIHTLRRSYAQAMEERRGEAAASAGLDHESPETTRRHYLGKVVKRRQLAAAVKGQDVFNLLPTQPGPDDTPDSNVIQLESRRKAS